MYSKLFVLLFAFAFLVSASVSAQVLIKGSVGHESFKRYGPFTTGQFSGTALAQLIFDNSGSDLDIWLTFYSTSSGEIELQGSSSSGNRNSEILQIGVYSNTQYYVYVSSYSGASPFRLSLDCTCTVSAAGASTMSGIMELPEAPRDAASMRFVEMMRKREREIKK